MLRIRKGPAPEDLHALGRKKQSWDEVYGDEKRPLLVAAIAEQRGLCAYCMRRIEAGSDGLGQPLSTLEHWEARAAGGAILDWGNLLAVCNGRLDSDLICEKARGSATLVYNPAHPTLDVEERIRHGAKGDITIGTSADAERLRLNHELLKRNRLEVARAVLGASQRDARALRRKLDEIEQAEPLPEYAGVKLHYLRKLLRSAEQRGARLRKKPSVGRGDA